MWLDVFIGRSAVIRCHTWWGCLIYDLVSISLRNHSVTHGHHGQKLTDLRRGGLQRKGAREERMVYTIRWDEMKLVVCDYDDDGAALTWFFSMFWMRAGSSNSVELWLLEGRWLRRRERERFGEMHYVKLLDWHWISCVTETEWLLTWNPPLIDPRRDLGSACG